MIYKANIHDYRNQFRDQQNLLTNQINEVVQDNKELLSNLPENPRNINQLKNKRFNDSTISSIDNVMKQLERKCENINYELTQIQEFIYKVKIKIYEKKMIDDYRNQFRDQQKNLTDQIDKVVKNNDESFFDLPNDPSKIKQLINKGFNDTAISSINNLMIELKRSGENIDQELRQIQEFLNAIEIKIKLGSSKNEEGNNTDEEIENNISWTTIVQYILIALTVIGGGGGYLLSRSR